MERVYSSACVSTDTTEEWRKFYLAAIQHCDFMLSVIQSYRFMNRGEKREKQIKLSPETPKTNQKQWFISIGEKKKRKKKDHLCTVNFRNTTSWFSSIIASPQLLSQIKLHPSQGPILRQARSYLGRGRWNSIRGMKGGEVSWSKAPEPPCSKWLHSTQGGGR